MLLISIFIGFIQGITEFLPISSSAHIRVFTELLGAGDWGAHFTAICQIGTEAAVIVYLRKEISTILRNWFRCLIFGKNLKERFGFFDFQARLGWFVIIGTIPVVVLGIVLKPLIEGGFRNLFITSFALIFFGLILGVLDNKSKQKLDTSDLNVKQAILFGLGQALALIPGVSRSGGTMSVGRALGFNREAAARYSFLLAIPAVFGSGLFELIDVVKNPPVQFPGFIEALVATLVAFIVGYLSIAVFLKIVSKHSYRGFVIYRIFAGVILLILLLSGFLSPV